MRKTFALTVVALVLGAASVQAAPAIIYNPVNGNLVLRQDLLPAQNGGVMAVANLSSTAGALSVPAGSVLPGVGRDVVDIPNFLVFFDVPNGSVDLGNIVTPQTPIGDLGFKYFITFGGTSVEQTGAVELAPAVPEPATVGLAGMALIGFSARRRRA